MLYLFQFFLIAGARKLLDLSPVALTPRSKSGRRYFKWNENDTEKLKTRFKKFLLNKAPMVKTAMTRILDERVLDCLRGFERPRQMILLRTKLNNMRMGILSSKENKDLA